MSKPSPQNTDPKKHRQGAKRPFRVNDWYTNKDAHRIAEKNFTAEGTVPNNPNAYQSFVPKGSMFETPGSSDADNVFYRNPYGDAEKLQQAQGPELTSDPTQWGKYGMGSAMAKDAGKQEFLATRGPASEMSPPRGMSTSLGGFGSGPRRNVEKPKSMG